MKELKFVEKLQRGDSLLSMPQSLTQILNMVGKDDFSMEDLSEVILKDPGLTSKILKMANSAFYRQRSQISTVKQAVVMLGMMQVKCLALSASVFQTERLEDDYNLDMKELSSHFISVAIGCNMLADVLDINIGEEVFVAGLLHDIGMVYFIHHFPDDYKQVISRLEEYPSLIEAERNILGIDHATIGGMLAEKWNFPKPLCDSISKHHELPSRIDEIGIVEIVQLSELISKSALDNRPQQIAQRIAAVNQMCSMMDISREKIDDISFSLLTETITTAEYMGIDIGEPNEVLTRANKELFNSFITIENLFRERQELSQRILVEERRTAAMEAKNVAIATLSHYLNNSTMAISGRAQLIKMMIDKGTIVDKEDKMDHLLGVVEKSVLKILAVLAELRDLTNLEDMERYSESNAINIDDRIACRMVEMEEIGLTIVEQSNEF
ncbi:MAG: HDOD domain-containing protein [FCB group bacterium]|nr:HDOD domain-containing protein [FCB group bacterium]